MKKNILILICLILISQFFAMAKQNEDRERPLYANNLVKIKLSSEAVFRAQLPLSAYAECEKTNLNELDQLFEVNGVQSIIRAHISAKDRNWETKTGFDRWFLLRLDGTKTVEQVIANLKSNRYIEDIIPEYYAYLHNVPDDPLYPNNWGHNNTAQLPVYQGDSHSGPGVGVIGFDSDAEIAWDSNQGYGDPDIIIGILDTGVDLNHPDLLLVSGYDFGDNDDNPMDDSAEAGHGTCTSGIAAAKANNILGVAGIAGGCSVMPLKVASSNGDILYSAITNALIYAADNNVNVVSMSFGSNSHVGDNPTVDSALEYAYNNGVILFASTGNANSATIGYPAIHPLVISVGAASPSGERKNPNSSDGENWWGSNYGTNQQDAAGAVDIMAPTILPATDITSFGGYSLDDYFMWFNGTSCSCPYAAGVAALVLSVNPTLTPAELRTIITSSATDMTAGTSEGWDRWTGYGMVNVAQALCEANPSIPLCHIVYPLNNTGFEINSVITIQVEASDPVERSILEVRFYLDDNPDYVFSDSEMPYEWVWNTAGLSIGQHTIKAEAIDNEGNRRYHTISISLLNPADEGFETADFSKLIWLNKSSSPWTVQSDSYFTGEYSACSGLINAEGASELKLKVNITEAGEISFYRKVSSLANYGYLKFYIDDELIGEWSGEKDWACVSFPVNPGLRTFSWAYQKNSSNVSGSDCCWIDHIIMPPYENYYWPPQNLTAAGGYGFVLLYWKVPEAGEPTGYNILKNNVLLTTIAETRYTDTDVVADISYEYTVVAVYAEGQSESTSAQTAIPTSEVVTETIIGNGIIPTSNYEGCPINNYRKSLHGQMIYTARELNLHGIFGPTIITRLGFYINTASAYSLPNFRIRMAHTTAEDVSQWLGEDDLITCYLATNYRPVAGDYDMLTFSTPFLWNGIDNILVDTAFSLTVAVNSSGTVLYTDTPKGYHYTRSNVEDQTDVFTGGAVTMYKPNMKLSVLTQPDIAVNTTNLSFGNVLAGYTAGKTFNITNTGTGYLNGEITVPAGYKIVSLDEEHSSLSYSIRADSTAVFTVLFAPLAPGVYNGIISITHNGEGEERIINLSAVSLTALNTPFIEGFENYCENWTFVNEGQTNKWFYGFIVPQSGNGGLFVSGDNGLTNSYVSNRGSTSYIYRDIYLPQGTENCKLRFSWKGMGEGTNPYFDFLRVFCVEPNFVPQAGTMITSGQLGTTLNLSDHWKEADFNIPEPVSGVYKRIVFAWRNDASGETQPPAAIDNVRVILNSNTDYAYVYDGSATVNLPAVSDTLGHTYHGNLIITGITEPDEYLVVTAGFASLNEPFSDAGMDFTVTGANFSGAEITFNHNLGYVPYYLGYKIEGRGEWMTFSAAPNWTDKIAYFTVPVYYGNATNISFCFPHANNVSPYYPELNVVLDMQNVVSIIWKCNYTEGISAYQIWRGSSPSFNSAVAVSDLIPHLDTQEENYVYTDTTTDENTRYFYWLRIINIDESSSYWGPKLIVTGTDPLQPPPETTLLGAYPNPFRYGTNISYTIKNAGNVEFKIYNLKGQLVNNYLQYHNNYGTYIYEYTGTDKKGKELASGLYICYMKFGNKTFVQKIIKAN
ncbi:MAG TPA: S8 family serine peptidase [Candidatus Cloacimonas sp.]|nr:S8 family serine peptidase [Candidatus Cloacimonas sp.]